MNKIINVSFYATDETKSAIKSIVDQLEKYNYAISPNPVAKSLFSRKIPKNHKTNGVVFIEGPVIALKHGYCIERCDDFKFRIKVKF